MIELVMSPSPADAARDESITYKINHIDFGEPCLSVTAGPARPADLIGRERVSHCGLVAVPYLAQAIRAPRGAGNIGGSNE
jgi:hypothetical protein